MIIITLIVISVFCLQMEPVDSGLSDGYVAVNHDNYWTSIGFMFFMFEGIGGIMPLMAASKDREKFPYLLGTAMLTLCVI